MRGLSQESRLSSYFCSDNGPPDFFQTSITSLNSLYEYLAPKHENQSTSAQIATDKVRSENLIAYERGEIGLWDFIQTEKALFLVFGVIIAVNIIILIILWPYVCVRGCCKRCKKDHTRTDYRKAEKMRPAVWYLILASAYLVLSIWSLYFVCSMYAAV